MNAISADRKLVARTAATAFGGTPRVVRYWDENNESCVDLLVAGDSPSVGETSVATVSLADVDIGAALPDGRALRSEIVGVAYSRFAELANMISTCAFNVINSGMALRPGEIYRGVVAMYRPTGEMQHVLLKAPFLWADRLRDIEDAKLVITWLFAVPISEAELRYADLHSEDALDELLGEHNIDVLDLDRPSVV